MPRMTRLIGTPIFARAALAILRARALTMFGMLPGISLPPETSSGRMAARIPYVVVLGRLGYHR